MRCAVWPSHTTQRGCKGRRAPGRGYEKSRGTLEMYFVACRMSMSVVVFFFSSRRRHTRLQGDWSSDVCSSDLIYHSPEEFAMRKNDYSDPHLGAWRAYYKALVEAKVYVGANALELPETGTTEIGRASCRERV